MPSKSWSIPILLVTFSAWALDPLVKIIFFLVLLSGCVGVSSKGIFGTGVSVALDPRTVGTQMDDSIMQKNLATRILVKDKKYLLSVKSKVLFK